MFIEEFGGREGIRTPGLLVAKTEVRIGWSEARGEGVVGRPEIQQKHAPSGLHQNLAGFVLGNRELDRLAT